MTAEQHADAILRAAASAPLASGMWARDERTAILAAVTAAMEDGRAELAAENARLRECEAELRGQLQRMIDRWETLRTQADELAGALKPFADTDLTSDQQGTDFAWDVIRARTALAKHREMK